jgi:anti-sigma factor (TIGR02949 family)
MSAKVISIREGACRCARNRIDAFLQHELPPNTMRWFLRHLFRCRNCQHELDQRGRAKQRMRAAVRDDTAPPGLSGRIINQIRAEGARVTPQFADTKNPA